MFFPSILIFNSSCLAATDVGHLTDETKPNSNRCTNFNFRPDPAGQLQTTLNFDVAECLLLPHFWKVKFEIYNFAVQVSLKFVHLSLRSNQALKLIMQNLQDAEFYLNYISSISKSYL